MLTRDEALTILNRETERDVNPKQTLTVGMLDAMERVCKAQVVDDGADPKDVPNGAASIGFFPDLDAVPDGFIWTADVRFVLDELERMSEAGFLDGRLDARRAGILGHSFGGATAGQVCLEDPRCLAGCNLDGLQVGGMLEFPA